MSRIKRLFLLVTMILMTVILDATVYADELELHYLDVLVTKNDMPLLIKKDSIFYTNNDIRFSLHNSDETAENDEINALAEQVLCNTTIDENIEYKNRTNYFYGYSKAVNGQFPAYEELENGEYLLNKELAENTEALIFTKIMYVTVYYLDDDGKEHIVGKNEKRHESDVFRIAVDDVPSEISYVEDDDFIHIFTEDKEAGIRRFSIVSDEKIIDSVNLSEKGCVANYDHIVSKSVFNNAKSKGEFTVEVEDNAGNISTLQISFLVDEKAPEAAIGGVEDNKIYGENVTAYLTASDDTFVNVWYRCDFIDTNGNESVEECFLNECKSNGFSDRRTYSKEGAYYVRMYAYDNFGNESDMKEYSFGIDKSSPEIVFEGADFTKIQNGTVNLSVGVKELFYDGMNVDIKAFKHNDGSKIELPLGGYSVGAKNNKNVYVFDRDGEYSVSVKAKDSSLNESERTVNFTIDKTAPEIDILFNNEYVKDKVTLNKEPSITLNVIDATFKDTDIDVSLSKQVKGGVFEKVSIPKFKMDKSESIFYLPETGEGKYELSILAKDGGGNISTKKYQYTLDYTPPVIERLSAFDRKFLKNFIIPDNLKDGIVDLTDVTYKAYLNGKETGPLNIKKDGKYILQVVATDEGGNTSEEMIAFIVDSIKPTVILNGLNDRGMLEKDRAINFSLNDSDDYFTDIFVNGVKIALSDDKKSATWIPDGAGDFRIYVAARDSAGNITTETIEKRCEAILSAPLVKELSVESLTKNENNFEKNNIKVSPLTMWILCGIICATAVILVIFAFVDTANNS
ncbi:MAG: Ig-like domain-containing protein [Lachnospiraceae bacterium]|nr:Ig-like domain-containing protein [Lachnospiraceae bacterium]